MEGQILTEPTPPLFFKKCIAKQRAEKGRYLRALEPAGAYWTSKKALVLGMTAVDEKDR